MENIALTIQGVTFCLKPKNLTRNDSLQIERTTGIDKLSSVPTETTRIQLQNFTGTLTVSSFLDIALQNGMSQSSRRPTPSPPSTPISFNEKPEEGLQESASSCCSKSDYTTPRRCSKAPQSPPAQKKRKRTVGAFSPSPIPHQIFQLEQQTQNTEPSLKQYSSLPQPPNPPSQIIQDCASQVVEEQGDCEMISLLSQVSEKDEEDTAPNSIVEEDHINLNALSSPLSTKGVIKEQNTTLSLPCGRWGHTMTMIDKNRMIVYGGQFLNKNDDFETSSNLSVFDLIKREWDEPVTNDTNLPRCWHTSNFIPERHLVITIGGESTDKSHAGKSKRKVDVMLLDTDIMLWYAPVMTGIVPTGRSGHTSSYLSRSGDIVVFGGVKRSKWLNSFSVLDINRWRWTHPIIVGNPPPPRSYHTATVVGEESKRIVVFGGNDNMRSFNSVHVLDHLSNAKFSWSHPNVSGQAPEPRTGHSAVLLEDQKSILIYGGWDPNLETNEEEECIFKDCFILDIVLWSWRALEGNELKFWDGCMDGGGKRVGHSGICMPSDYGSAGQDVLFFGGRLPDDTFANDFQMLHVPNSL